MIYDYVDWDIKLMSREQFREAFDKFNTDGKLLAKHLGNVLRYIGFDPTEKEIQDYIKLADPEHVGGI